MAAFATVDQLRALPGVTVADDTAAERLLGMVSSAISSMCDTDEVAGDVLALVTCQATARMMQADGGGFGVSQESWGANPYSGSVTYANPSGDLYLTAFEKSLLGIDAPDAGMVVPRGL